MKTITLLFALFSLNSFGQDNPYQIGPTWGKAAFMFESQSEFPSEILRQGKSVAKFLGGSAFYLGKFDGRHIMATNYHVLPTALNCYSFAFSEFALTGLYLPCKRFVASFSDIELSLFEVKVRPEKEPMLEGLGLKFNPAVRASGNLYGLGYGIQGNPSPSRKALLLSRDEHCRTFSDEIQHMKDPDEMNPVDYRVWSQPIGCDFSHGDSGAAVLNEFGEFAGIFWTGAVPKPATIRNPDYLNELIAAQDERLWKELSYMVPVEKMVEVLGDFLRKHPDHESYDVIQAIID